MIVSSVVFGSPLPLVQGERTEVRGCELPSTGCLDKILTLPSPCKGEATQTPRSALPIALVKVVEHACEVLRFAQHDTPMTSLSPASAKVFLPAHG